MPIKIVYSRNCENKVYFDNKTTDIDGFLLVNESWSPRVLDMPFTGKVRWKTSALTACRMWFYSGMPHRMWFYSGMPHRIDGPAIEWANGTKQWFYMGKEGLDNFPLKLKKELTRKFLST